MYTITRQIQWPKGDPVVEVSEGGIDYTNPDALVANYPGEFQKFEDPREAVETAINICRAWREDGEKGARIGVGATGGMTMPFDGGTFKEARKWANEIWDKLEKCPTCGAVVEDLKEWWNAGEWMGDDFTPFDHIDEKYCSEYCAEKASIFSVECSLCGGLCDAKTAHLHQDGYIGDECCWDERLKSSE